ncbi:ABC transporter ATP-binding protein [Haliangium ochraceum]|uniref:ABC transporter related protein n=1 Tax=Haliangium ochraceum (strain DSM 14365 / JCM 11303 / SMP-2) TaxID=502025 RepID=D0LVA3_HALO1|nr:ATP-binding cassette domain-containing protein [Haliangium ochraceum]ACY15944.1 ABC transporter related protein [Haliangium ochraceum DSM 14365]
MIRLRDVHKGFAGKPVLRGIDLEVARGKTLGIIGPAASGKSVLLKLVCGLLPADRGTITVADCELGTADDDALAALHRRIGMLFQHSALFDFLSVHENVAFPLERRGQLDSDEITRQVETRLRQLGLAGSGALAPSELSGGMKKRVALARATVARPEIVVYDEPTAGLDPVTTSKVYDLLRSEREHTGATVLLVSSDVAALLEFADDIAMLLDGRIHYCGPAASVAEAEDPTLRQFVRGELRGPLS